MIDEIRFTNRWKRTKYRREENWTVFGVYSKTLGPVFFYFGLAFFGFDIQIWFKRKRRTLIKTP
jgi:hypothetical protein